MALKCTHCGNPEDQCQCEDFGDPVEAVRELYGDEEAERYAKANV